MLIDLTCPHCKAVVAAREADRGESVRCGICWNEVPVPVAVPVDPPVDPKPVKAAVLPTAKLIPSRPLTDAAPRPDPRPVVATPVRVAPVAPVPVSAARDVSPPPRMRSTRRDDDESRDGSDRKSPVGMLLLLSLLGLLIVGGLTVGIIVLVGNAGSNNSADGSKSTSKDGYVEPQQLWDPKNDPGRFAPPPANDPVPPFNPAPVVPPAPKPAKEPDWVPVENADGFEAKVPGKMTVRDGIPLMGTTMRIRGKTYSMFPPANIRGVAHLSVQIDYCDIPAEYAFDAEKVLREITRLHTGPAGPAKLSGLSCTEITETIGGVSVRQARGVKVGPRFFVVKCDTRNPAGQYPKSDEYRTKVFDSFTITFDEMTPPPPARDAFGRPAPAGPVVPPVVATAPAGPPTAPYVVAKPLPFWAAVFLPDRNEMLTVGPRLQANFGRGGGVLRRYALPGFQLKASYPMPRAATRAVYDVATATLYCTTLTGTRPDTTIRDSERVVAFGDVEAYDLGPVFKGTATEKDELKPAFTVPFSTAKLTGLDLSPDGKWLYTVRTTPVGSPTKPRGWKASLVRIDVSQRKVLDPIDLPAPVLEMKMAPDGRSIYLAEILNSDVGGEGLGTGPAGKVDAIDVTRWRLKHNILLSAPVLDLSLTKDGTRIVCGLQGRFGPTVGSAGVAGGEIMLFDPPSDPARSAGYAAVTPNGRRIVTAARLAEGVDVFEVTDLGRKEGLKLLARGKEAAGTAARTPLGGHFYLSPDGRFAAFQVGAVVDVDSPTKKPD